jgi:hypothetical protein
MLFLLPPDDEDTFIVPSRAYSSTSPKVYLSGGPDSMGDPKE